MAQFPDENRDMMIKQLGKEKFELIPEFCMKLLDFDIKKKKSPG
jgi:hypothetical protein